MRVLLHFGYLIAMNKIVLLLVIISIVFVAPCFAADKAHSAEGAMGLVSTLLYTYVPWIVGFVLDTGISKMSVKLIKALMTSTLSMVLGYPSVLFAFTSLAAPSGVDSILAWVLASVVLVIGLGTVKIVSYWVANEAFPSKKIAALLYLNAVIMVGAAFITHMMTRKA